jgi:hypothetical protein
MAQPPLSSQLYGWDVKSCFPEKMKTGKQARTTTHG